MARKRRTPRHASAPAANAHAPTTPQAGAASAGAKPAMLAAGSAMQAALHKSRLAGTIIARPWQAKTPAPPNLPSPCPEMEKLQRPNSARLGRPGGLRYWTDSRSSRHRHLMQDALQYLGDAHAFQFGFGPQDQAMLQHRSADSAHIVGTDEI